MVTTRTRRAPSEPEPAPAELQRVPERDEVPAERWLQQHAPRHATRRAGEAAAPHGRRSLAGPPPAERPDFDFQDMVWGFCFAASLSGGHVTGAIVIIAGFIVQKQLRRDPTPLRQAGDYLTALLPGRDELPRLRLTGQRRQLRDAREEDAQVDGDAPSGGADTEPAAADDEPLFEALQQRPHRLLIGYTGGGKTTLMHALATAWAAQGREVHVCDPDAAPGQWPGCRVVGGGDDYEAIAKTLALIDGEFTRRSQARSRGQRHFPITHLLIDEVQETIASVAGAWEILEPIIRRGRKLGLRLTIGVQDSQVDTLDLQGKSHLLHNLVTAELYIDDTGQRVARIKGRTARDGSLFAVPTLTDPESLIISPPTSEEHGAVTGATSVLPRPQLGSAMASSAAHPHQATSPAEGPAVPLPAQVVRLSQHRIAAAHRPVPDAAVVRRPPAPAPDPFLAALLGVDLSAVSPERRARLDAILTRQEPVVPTQQDAEERVVTPLTVRSNRAGGQSSVTVETGNGSPYVTVNATLISGGGRRSRDAQSAQQQALIELYRAAGAEGKTFAQVYKEHRGTKELVFPAWQEGRRSREAQEARM